MVYLVVSQLNIADNGSLPNNPFCLLISLDTCTRKISNILFSGAKTEDTYHFSPVKTDHLKPELIP